MGKCLRRYPMSERDGGFAFRECPHLILRLPELRFVGAMYASTP
jgi:hypothetical protein